MFKSRRIVFFEGELAFYNGKVKEIESLIVIVVLEISLNTFVLVSDKV